LLNKQFEIMLTSESLLSYDFEDILRHLNDRFLAPKIDSLINLRGCELPLGHFVHHQINLIKEVIR
jgi:hypothetical protein